MRRLSGSTPAHVFFFPAAAVYAMLALPASVLSMQTGNPLLPGLSTALHHGHEMLFGFALAVVAGFLLTRPPRGRLYVLAALWLAARITYVIDPYGLAAGLANIAFPGLLAAEAAPRFIRAAKKWRNQVFGPMLVVLALLAPLFHAVVLNTDWPWRRDILHEAVLVFGVLMFFMGGRIIAPAVAGHLQRNGVDLEARVQPAVEGAVLLLLLTALVAMPWEASRPLAATAVIAAGCGTAIRVLRWRLWLCRGRPDLVGLGVGYAWLAVGLVLIGLALLVDTWRVVDALHALTVGAVGTLTLSVMARTRLLHARSDPSRPTGIPLAVTLVGLAALLRLTAAAVPLDAWPAGWPGPWHAYWLAALCWSLAYLLLVRLIWRT